MIPEVDINRVAEGLDDATIDFYLRALDVLDSTGIRYVVGGAYAMACHAGIIRHTKDLDVFLKAGDVARAIDAFASAGYRTELTHPHWVGKAFERPDGGDPEAFIDMIFGSGNGLAVVDDEWLDHGTWHDLLGRRVPLSAAEEMIWSKAFVQERERYDGADVTHLLLARAHSLDWPRLFRRFEGHERVLLAHLLNYGYVFPSEKRRVPGRVMDYLYDRLRSEPPTEEKICRGTYLSWCQYRVDLEERGFADARLRPRGNLTQEQIDRWTDARK